jgi:glycosyltransferase involved in cell wall biosynthesis
MSSNQLVSIIIPAFNEQKVIERLLISISKQSYKNIELIVVDDSSTDETPKLAKKYTKNVYIRPHAERSVQRNFGAKKSKGDYLLFVDADMELTKNVVSECVEKILLDKKIGAIAIPEASIANTYWEKVKAFERSFYNESGDEQIDAARFFARVAFEKVGGYDESITGPEDWDLPESIKKLGFKIERIKSRLNHYERVPNPFKLAQKKFYYGIKAHRYFSKQNVPLLGSKTIYFLRPVFYKNWKKLVSNPIMSISMIFMLTLEQVGGGMGFLLGKFKNI